MKNIYQKHIDVPVDPDSQRIADNMMYYFGVHAAGENGHVPERYDDPDDLTAATIRLDPMAQHIADRFAEELETIRHSPIALHYAVGSASPLRENGGGSLCELMVRLGILWTIEMGEGQIPTGPFAPPEQGGRPAAASGADFIYMCLTALGLQFSNEEFKDQFLAMQRELRDEFELDDD